MNFKLLRYYGAVVKLAKFPLVAAKGRAIGIELRDGKERHTKAAAEHQ